MQRALDLAKLADGQVFPNPYVGAVLVHRNRIIGEGWHQRAGGAHAERIALEGIPEEVAMESTLYVTLEPCSHYGKTPPCAPYVVEKRVKRVVIATEDPNHLVAGRGIAYLQDRGVLLRTGVLSEEARRLNRRFFTYHQQRRPYVILKWAQTLDGIIGIRGQRLPVSNEIVNILVHRWRSREHAVLVTDHTIHNDNACLTVRHWPGYQPWRVVFATRPRVPLPVAFQQQKVPTLIFNATETNPPISNVSSSQHKIASIRRVLDWLYQRQIVSVMVEGGASLLRSWILSDMWDEIRLIVSETTVGQGIPSPSFNGVCVARYVVDDNHIFIFKNHQNRYL